MERIFKNFDRSAHGRKAEATISSPERRPKPFNAARGITRAAPGIVGASLLASLGYGVAAYMAGHNMKSAEHAGRDLMTTATTAGAQPARTDFALLSVMSGPKVDHINYHLVTLRQRPKIDHAASENASKTTRQGQDRETAAEKLRREYAEDAAITRQLNADALNTVVTR